MKIWDYHIPEDWKPTTKEGWLWYIEKMVTTGNLHNLKAATVKKYLPDLHLDEGNQLLLNHYFFGRTKHGA